MRREFEALRRKQLSAALESARSIMRVQVPRGGWIRAIRTALGMPQTVLGARLGVSQAAVAQFERAEQSETATLETLRRVAAAMECEFVYVILPRQTLDEMRLTEAKKAAARTVAAVARSMALEEQALTQQQMAERVEELARRLLDENPRMIWSTD